MDFTTDLQSYANMLADLLNENGWQAANIGIGMGHVTIWGVEPCKPGEARIPFIGKTGHPN